MPQHNLPLLMGAALSFLAALVHFACIPWGANGFRFLGAGEPMARMSEAGHWYPPLMAFGIGAVLSVWGGLRLVWRRIVAPAAVLARGPGGRDRRLSVACGGVPFAQAGFPGQLDHLLAGHLGDLSGHRSHPRRGSRASVAARLTGVQPDATGRNQPLLSDGLRAAACRCVSMRATCNHTTAQAEPNAQPPITSVAQCTPRAMRLRPTSSVMRLATSRM